MEVEGWTGQKLYGEVLDEMVKAGYEGTELGPYGFLPTEPKRLTAELSSRRISLLGAFVPLPLATPGKYDPGLQEALKVADLLAQSGAPSIVLADEMSEARMAVAGRLEESNGLTSRQWEQASQFITKTARACKERGLDVIFHHHVGTFVETPREIEQLCERTDPELVGICLDTGHYHYGGGDAVEAVQRYGRRIRYLHFKDVKLPALDSVRRDKAGFLDAVRRGVFCELGDGVVDFPRVSEALLDCGFDGWAVVEQDVDTSRPSVNPLESATRSRRYLREVIRI
jgi:inosose dehydratase